MYFNARGVSGSHVSSQGTEQVSTPVRGSVGWPRTSLGQLGSGRTGGRVYLSVHSEWWSGSAGELYFRGSIRSA